MNKYESTVELQYALAELYDRLDTYARENGGEVNEEIDNEITELELLLDNRAGYYLDTICDLEDQIKGGEMRIKAIQKTLSEKGKRADSLRSKLESLVGHTPFASDKNAMSWKVSKRTVVNPLIEEDIKKGIVPDHLKEYCKIETITTVKLPKADLKKAIDSGVEIDGVKIEENWTMKTE